MVTGCIQGGDSMRCNRFIALFIVFILAGCQVLPVPPTPTPGEARSTLGIRYDPNNPDAFQVDIRSRDLSTYDLQDSAEELLHSNFDTRTKWPGEEWLPEGFDPGAILENGKDPGLGLRELHLKGITGEGVSIAIIDQALYQQHSEYTERIAFYETSGNPGYTSMHGPAVASIAVGKTVGVAPRASLYFIAAEIPSQQNGDQWTRDFTYMAKAVRRIVEVNRTLAEGEKIRVLSMSIGWDQEEPGYEEMVKAVDEAKQAGIFVISSSLEETYEGFQFNGLGRDPSGDPNQVEAYEAGSFWAPMLSEPKWVDYFQDRILVPMDSRTYASRSGSQEYEWARSGGWSWCAPYLAGLYALAVQVQPEITPEAFWQAVKETSLPISIYNEGKEIQIGRMIQPAALMEGLGSSN
jgi:hypothetical protein